VCVCVCVCVYLRARARERERYQVRAEGANEVLGADDEEQITRDALRKVQHLWRV
jgi:hypothetical protein